LKRPLNIAHRGASADEHENTVASINKAIDLGADMVEFDLRRTADGTIVLWHDECIKHSIGIKLPISKITIDELRRFSGENRFQLATFEEVLKIFGSRVAFDIEIKTPGFEKEVIRLLKENPPQFPPLISSFRPDIIRKFKKLDCSFRTGLVIGNSRIFRMGFIVENFLTRYVLRSRADSVHLDFKIASPFLINDLTELGYEIYIWTVNEPKDMQNFIALEVDGIISDKSDLLNSLIGAKRKKSISL
jgi:glycerophosphoryl diester phosphodiesterase